MSFNLDAYFGIHANALSLRDKRATEIAHNLANANTPNFKAKDMDFQEALSQMMTQDSLMKTSSSNHLQGSKDIILNMKERIPTHTSLDGNTVDKDQETIEFTRNSLNYQASLTFLDNKIKSMLLAIKGE